MNASPLSKNTTTFQTARPSNRDADDIKAGLFWPTTSPAATTASTPEK